MRPLVGVAGGALVAAMLVEIFVTFLLPRRVKRDPRVVRSLTIAGWRLWRRLAARLPEGSRDTMLGVYGPLAVILNLVLWVALMMVGFACVLWSDGSHLGLSPHPGAQVDFGSDLYYAAATMAVAGPAGLAAHSTFAKVTQVIDAATGLAVLAVVIGYLPALFQAFSARETTVSQLDARAGSPPSAGRLIVRSTQRGGWPALARYLAGWEEWAAELMETHLAYPTLAYFRSQHVNQNWLASICTVLDTCTVTIACAPRGTVDPARFTYAIARHAVVDLSYTFRVEATPPRPERLTDEGLARLLAELRGLGVEIAADDAEVAKRVTAMRSRYEPYVNALSMRLELRLPPWLAPESESDNWRTTEWH